MKPLHPKLSAGDWESALRASERIWPEPALAPEVPPETEMERYLTIGPFAFTPDWLREQIAESAACQRALEDLRLRRLLGDTSSLKTVLEKAGFRVTKQAGPVTSPPPSAQSGPIGFGELRRSRGLVFVFTERGARKRQTFRPMLILPVEGPLLEVEEQFWRAIVCTPMESWPEEYFADDEIVVRSSAGHDYIAHLWLEYPVAALQIGDKVGELAPVAMENLLVARAAHGQGLPLGPEPSDGGEAGDEAVSQLVTGFRLDPATDVEALRAREQLHDCADWLSATLDARLESEAWQNCGWRTAAEDAAQKEFPVQAVRAWELCGYAAAPGGTGEFTQCLEWSGPLHAFQALLSTPKTVQECQSFTAECLLPPEQDEEDAQVCRAQWSLATQFSHLVGRRFAVFYPVGERLLGVGTVRSQGEGLPLLAELENGLWRDFENVPLNGIILLFPKEW